MPLMKSGFKFFVLALFSVVSAFCVVPLLADEKDRVDRLCERYEKRGALFSIRVETDDGKVLYERNSKRALVAASLVKVVVTGAALNVLPLEHKFRTQVFIRGAVGNGFLKGNIIVRGEGDVSISERFYSDPREVFFRWAKALRGLGIKEVKGDIVVDGTYFDDEYVPPVFPREQLLRPYCAPISAISFNDNTVWVVVGAGRVGSKADVRLSPTPDLYRLINRTTTVAGRKEHLINIKRSGDGIVVEGKCYRKVSFQKFNISVEDPLLYFGRVLKKVLTDGGVKVDGDVKVTKESINRKGLLVDEHSIGLASFLGVMNRESVNLYAEVLLKVLGRVGGGMGSRKNGLSVVKEYLNGLGVGADEWVLTCGSGLSRRDALSASAMVKVLKGVDGKMSLRLLLPTAGVDGTLRKRFRKSPLKGRLWAKTGHLRNSNGIAGVASVEGGGKVYFAVIINGAERFGAGELHSVQERIIEAFCIRK